MDQEQRGTRSMGTAVGGVGDIRSVGVLDLTAMKSPEDIERITSIRSVGVVLVPESLAEKLAGVPMKSTGAVVPIPDGQNVNVKLQTGQLRMSGEALANPGGQEQDVLVVAGQLIVTSLVQTVGYRHLIVVGQVIAPKGSETALGAGITRLLGQAVYYPYAEGADVQVLGGQLKLSGEALANPAGQEHDILVLAGQVVITSPVQKLGYRQLIVAGQFIAPRESEAILSAHLNSPSGQLIYYSGTPRVFTGSDRFAPEFFELLEGPVTLILTGDFVVEPGVTPDLLKRKISEIVLIGSLKAPRSVVPVLQVLATEKQGSITALEAGQNGAAAGEREASGDDA